MTRPGIDPMYVRRWPRISDSSRTPPTDRRTNLRPSAFAIARQFLVPKQLRLNGLDPANVEWDTDAIPSIVQGYTREAGVRELERRIGRISRKLARRRAESRDLTGTQKDLPKTVVHAADLHDLLGSAPHDPALLTLDHKVGVATGLAYTSAGGEVLEI